MIGTEFLNGQGLGNQLFSYVSSRCIAIDQGCIFGTANQEQFANNIHSNKGMYFLDVDLGEDIKDTGKYQKYYEKEKRIYFPYCYHDRTRGCNIAGADEVLKDRISDNTLIYGNLQDESYFISHKEEICNWLKVKKKYNSYHYTDDNLCIINMRGGEYCGEYSLFLQRSYWIHAIQHMKHINQHMRFIIITEDVDAARMVLPGVETHNLGMGEDYVAIHNARYLILSNSSFAFFPTFTNKIVKYIIAPKYWARHNVSDGFWASEQNIYSGWHYLDRRGNIFSAEECRRELQKYLKKKELKNISAYEEYHFRDPKAMFYKCREYAWHLKLKAMKSIR